VHARGRTLGRRAREAVEVVPGGPAAEVEEVLRFVTRNRYRRSGSASQRTEVRYRELSGVTAAGYLEKARSLFEALGLDWDLRQLDGARFTA